MRIKKKDIDSLSQLDRIEIRQEADLIRKQYSDNFMIPPAYVAMAGSYFCVLLMFITGVSSLEQADKLLLMSKLMKVVYLMIFMFVLSIFIAFLVATFNHVLKKKKLEELEEKYFKVAVIPREVKHIANNRKEVQTRHGTRTRND